MTLFLASVRDAEEAELALHAGADIVDLKDPAQGALGALPPDTIAACVKQVAGRAPVSATIGDLPLEGDGVRAAIRKTASLGVDYVKLGIFPGGDARTLPQAAGGRPGKSRVIVVLFADAMPDFDAVALAASDRRAWRHVRHHGQGRRLLARAHVLHGPRRRIAAAKAEGLIVGLAGSLQARHVPSLLALHPICSAFAARSATAATAPCPRSDRLRRASGP